MAGSRRVAVAGALAAAVAGALSVSVGCSTTWLNLTKERTGTVNLVFINTTPYRAAFTYGTYDAWDRLPGPVAFGQLALDGDTTSASISRTCARNVAVATSALVQRVLDTDGDEEDPTFEPDMFSSVVNFSDAPGDSEAALLPTVGTALGIEVRLGVDYSCGDSIFFTMVEDPDAEGGFRVDHQVVLDNTNE
jgi:hypothetical protein